MDKKILVADDEPSIRNALAYGLKREGYLVETAVDGEDALEKVRLFHPDVLVLDVMMPKLGGYEVCRRLESRKGIGILLLTAKNDIVDKVLGLELGADDFMSKPFDLRELLARIKALVRRLEREGAPAPEGSETALGPLRVRPSSRTAELEGTTLDLTPKEFDVLSLLVSHAGRVYTRDELLEQVWGFDYAGGTRTVDIHIQRLRKKLEPHQSLLQTVYGIGYKAEKVL
ncbi:response regulator transcription factor [Paenibacillus sp. 23TSA30-6]|uniref:response regulator transcription factor n=1 Tax=Paenibacillus sp. 23TSA30-6 TaxID=2546104 RepID=UPI001787EE28|nr:response regulator transcription factor [Paenibacillus sp. 23TSA30-6]MBE0337883.1 response regulator transcription factor [Paenibacillus sp. 23TSA30-6]